ncbi:MAG: type II secretion system protein [Acidimicrobiales bacterium]
MGFRRRRTSHHSEQGFTLIELLIVVAVMPIVVGGLAYGLLSVLSLQSSVSNRLSDSGDAQVVSVYYVRDVESAVNLTSSPTAACGTGTQLLGLEWSPNPSGVDQTVVSYTEVTNISAGVTTYSLAREYCASGASATPTTSSVVAHDISASQTAVFITCGASAATECAGTTPAYAAGWVSAVGIAFVKFKINAQLSSYTYALVATPAVSPNSGVASTVTAAPTTSCGFATAGTGTYAANLCFVDFTPWNSQTGTPCAGGGIQITAGIVNTPFTMYFCVSVSSAQCNGTAITGTSLGGVNGIEAVPFPTYFDPPTSEAFLGNNGFYTGVPGNPALYQTVECSTSIVTITNIEVLDGAGNPATGWELTTGDAESTDAGESITWSTGTGGPDLHLLPNSPSSAYGNACAAPTTQNPNAADLTGIGTSTVECAATVSSDKTGTVMLDALTPTSLTVTLVGTGLQAMILGLLLPS